MSLKPICVIILIGFLSLADQTLAQESQVDTVITDLYESISFNKTHAPDYEKFKSLFAEGARLISVKDTISYTLTTSDYEHLMGQQRKSGEIIAFEEYEIHRETDQYANIMHVFSTYQTQVETPQGKSTSLGINSIQLIKEDRDWKIVSIIWYEENKAHPLPKKYMPEISADG